MLFNSVFVFTCEFTHVHALGRCSLECVSHSREWHGSRTAQTRSWNMLPCVSKSFYFCLRHIRASFVVMLNSKLDGFAPRLVCFNLSEVFFRSSRRISRRVELCFLCSGELLWETVGCAGGKSSLVGTVTHSMHTSTVTALNLVMCWICAAVLGELLWSFLRGQFVFLLHN